MAVSITALLDTPPPPKKKAPTPPHTSKLHKASLADPYPGGRRKERRKNNSRASYTPQTFKIYLKRSNTPLQSGGGLNFPTEPYRTPPPPSPEAIGEGGGRQRTSVRHVTPASPPPPACPACLWLPTYLPTYLLSYLLAG